MRLTRWGRQVLVIGVIMVALGALPALLLGLLPPAFSQGFTGLVAVMLSLSVAPIGVLIAGVGVIVLLVGLVRRG